MSFMEEKDMENYLGESIPKLGFGLMRLPMCGEQIDLEQTKEMVDLFMDAGFRYFDTAYVYNDGESERAAKAALVERYPRESFYLATKLPGFSAKSKADAEQMFYTSLERTGAGYFDFYLLHSLGADRKKAFEDYDLWNFIAARRKEGLIRHIGFSFHDTADELDKLLTEHTEVEFVQLQINYIDWESATVQSRLCYETARRHGKPVIIMEPVKGGLLSDLPESAAAPLRAADPTRSISSWAVRFAASLEGVITVLSGMSTVDQVRDNLATMRGFKPFTAQESAAVRAAVDALNAIPTIPCTHCSYCTKGCPMNIAIPDIFSACNVETIYGNHALAQRSYGFAISRSHGSAADCIACGQCEAVCPQSLPIIDELKKAAEQFA